MVASKVRRPPLRPGTVVCSRLIDQLRHRDPRPIVSEVAPSGSGKTTLLADWAERNGRSFAWVSADERDSDPKVRLTCMAEALDEVEPAGGRVFEALASAGSSVRMAAVFTLTTVTIARRTPIVSRG